MRSFNVRHCLAAIVGNNEQDLKNATSELKSQCEALRVSMHGSLDEAVLERHEYPRIAGMVRSLFIRE